MPAPSGREASLSVIAARCQLPRKGELICYKPSDASKLALRESWRISAYGSTKLMGEKYVEQFCHRHFIVRTAWLYSYYGKNFVKTIVNAGKKFGKLEVVNDQCGNPTNAVDLAHEILQLCVTHEYGLYHCTGEGVCSWYDFASEIIRLSGVDATVAPCTSEEYKAKHPDSADRPRWSALDNRMLRCTVGNDVRDWKDALACFFTHWDGDNGMKD